MKVKERSWLGQSHETILLARPVPISIAPEAQRSLAPHFSVGRRQELDFSPVGATQKAVSYTHLNSDAEIVVVTDGVTGSACCEAA